MKFVPHEYQKAIISWLITHPEAALFVEPGLGKTACTLMAFQALRRAGGLHRALVVAPLRVCYQVWSQIGEIGKWDDFADLRVALLHDKGKVPAVAALARHRQAEVNLAVARDKVKAKALKVEAEAQLAEVYVVNYDGLAWLHESGTFRLLLDAGVDLLVLDELSKVKHPKTLRFRTLKPWLGRFRRRFGLTGTPCSNSLLDLFGQAYCLDLGRSLGRFVTHYRNRWFLPTGYGGYTWVPRPGAEAEIHTALMPLAFSLRADAVLDLPELVERDLFVELPAEARRTYRQLEDELVTIVNDETVTAANKAVALNKCRQVTGGALYQEDPTPGAPKKVLAVHEAKLEALVDLVDELQGQPLLVAFEFKHELERIRQVLGNAPAIDGDASPAATEAAVAAWDRGELPVLCVQPAAAAHGLNLQRGGSHICWFTLTWDLELYEQLVHRLWRQGQAAHRVIVHILLARHSVDLAVRAVLRGKRRGQDALFAALRRRDW